VYVLRKSFGPYSAGTPVTLTERHLPNTNSDAIENVLVGGILGTPIEVPGNLLVKRRSRTGTAPQGPNSRERRRAKKEAQSNG